MASSLSIYLKIMLITSSLIFMAMLLKSSVPVIRDFVVYEAPMMWSYLISCLKPPYLYLLINSIIITIVASSKLQTSQETSPSTPIRMTSGDSDRVEEIPIYGKLEEEQVTEDFRFGFPASIGAAADLIDSEEVEASASNVLDDDEVEFVISRSAWTPRMKQFRIEPEIEPELADKPPASSRFSSRRSPKPNPEGGRGGLGVARQKKAETLESTWRMITEGKPMPLARHMRKSETFNNAQRSVMADSPPQKMMLKSGTFSGKENNIESPMSRKLRMELSMSHDELNRKVEAFIRKFNEEMRIQRQESLSQYKQMMVR